MALISVDEIADILGIDPLTSAQETVLELYIDFAVGEIETYLGRPVDVNEYEETVIPDADGRIYLNNTPVVEVTSITIDGVEADLSLFVITPWGVEAAYTPTRLGITVEYQNLDSFNFLVEPEMVVTYTAGLDAPNSVNSVIANGVIRKWYEREAQVTSSASGTLNVEEITVEDYSLKYDTQAISSPSSYGAKANPITIFRSDLDFLPIRRLKRRSVG